MTDLQANEEIKEFRALAQNQVSLLWILAVLLRERLLLLSGVGIGVLIALVITVVRIPTYSTLFSFVPQTAQDPSRAGLASLAGQFGLSLGSMTGQAQSPQFYAELLTTREILAPIALDSMPISVGTVAPRAVRLATLLGVSGDDETELLENTLRVLRQDVIRLSVADRTTGVVTVTVKTDSPALSLQIAERLLSGLNQFNLSTRQSQAAAERRFVEGRLDEARTALREAEDNLLHFLETNMVTRSPQLTIQRDRLERNVALRQQLVTGLEQQFEDARIREVRDTPVLTVIERPIVAGRPDPRRRLFTLLAGASVGFLLAVSWVLLQMEIERRRLGQSDSASSLFAREWGDLRATILRSTRAP